MSHEKIAAPKKQTNHHLQGKPLQRVQTHAHEPDLQSVMQRVMANAPDLSPREMRQMQSAMGNRAVMQWMQTNSGGDGDRSPTASRANASGGGVRLPRPLQRRAEALSGMSLEHVRVHYNSSDPKEYDAAAYAQGSDIHLGPGEEKHLPHETWHVVQQAQGRVAPTLQMKGRAVNDDEGLEREADIMGAKLVQASEEPAATSATQALPPARHSAVKQLARLDNSKPVLANGRDLLEDVKDILINDKRMSTTQDNLLDTTYANIGENLLLDLNMLFEEHLQREVEHNSNFTRKVQEVVSIIHRWLTIESVDRDLDTDNIKQRRIEFVLKYISEHVGKEVTVQQLKAAGWNLEEVDKLDNEELKRKVGGYIKLLKMLETQYPYFGGSKEYHENKKDSFEFWIYHLSTLTKDPDRQYKADSPRVSLKKSMIDYRTRPEGVVPRHNQRNLGTGIAEALWEELPFSMTRAMRDALSNVYATHEDLPGTPETKKRSYRKQLMNQLFTKYTIANKPLSLMLKEVWNKANEDDRKMIYGDIMMLPWSVAHIKPTHDLTPENVVGVMGNILEMPSRAKARYQADLEKYNDDQLQMLKHAPDEGELTREEILHDFEQKHTAWYQSAKANYKPIIGGISGHTLGYLNLYEEALGNAKRAAKKDPRIAEETNRFPSMEELRTIMLGALIGDKRHHSYDEVMAASHMMLTHDEQGTLRYYFPESYNDVLQSANWQIRSTAMNARNQTIASVNEPQDNTVLGMLEKKVYHRIFEEGEATEKINWLKQQIAQNYINSGFDKNAGGAIVESINEDVSARDRNLMKEALKSDTRFPINEAQQIEGGFVARMANLFGRKR